MALLLPPGERVTDRNGEPVSAGKIYAYLNRTTTYADLFSDPELTVALENPVSLDGGGDMPVPIFVEGGEKYTLRWEHSDGAEVRTRNDIFGWEAVSTLTVNTLADAKAGTYNDGDSVYIKGYGRYFYDESSTAASNDLTVILPDSGAGRLLVDNPDIFGLLSTYNIAADGVTDDTAGLQALLDVGGEITLPAGTYNFTNLDLTVAGTILRGSRKTILNCTISTNQFALHLQANNIRLEGFTLQGPLANSTYVANHTGIYGNNTSYGPVVINYLVGLEVIDLAIQNFGAYGIRFDYLQDSRIESNDLDFIGSHGIFIGAGSFDNVIDNNNIQNIVPGQTDQGSAPYHPAYGITITRDSARDTTEAPISKRNRITNNRIKNVPSWIGIDSHGSQETLISDNLVQLCAICIHLEDGNGGGSTVASERISITDNICIGNTGSGFEEGPGISLQGAGGASDLQRGIVVTGNQIINCGYDITGLYSTRHGAIHCYLVEGLVVSNNSIVTPYGIGIYMDNITGGVVTGNAILDVQTSNSDVYGLLIVDGDVSATIKDNTFFGASPQINIGSVSGTAGPDANHSIEVGRNHHHGTATKYGVIEFLHVWDGEYTSTQRDAITSAPNGMRIYNTTTNKLQVMANSVWVDLH